MTTESSEHDKSAEVGGPWAVYENIDSVDGGIYMDMRHPNVQALARKVLTGALESAHQRSQSLDELWNVFRDFIRQFEYAEALAERVKATRQELIAAIREDARTELRAEALRLVTKELRMEVGEQLRADIRTQLQPILEAEVRTQLIAHFNTTLRTSVEQEIRGELRRSSADGVREELMNDPSLKLAAVADLKRRIAGL